uniref:dolichyl-P-Man:Man5GlcNAc2-PP-dolichol alpha-1,3-mannosyltransferase n=1 Tax=Phlebotomus papatasi TaxID=29031 RepID=A0A1B0GPR1_PHLPP
MGKLKQSHHQSGKSNPVVQFIRKYASITFVKSLLFDPSRLPLVSWGILLAELLLNVIVVLRVPYTEIDWVAYMQECEGFLNGTLNYAMLRGDTGPLVYPAGFVYIYSIMYFLTGQGKNIRLAQYIFIGIYLLQMFLVLRIYSKSRKVPPYVLLLTTFTSYRIHSIYVLRLFNDPLAIVFLYAALNCFLDGKWNLGTIPVLDKMVSILPKFVTRVVGFDASLKDKVDVFCEAVCDNFKSFVEYAQPEKFWKKYRDGKRPKKGATEQREKLVIFEEEAEDFSL